MYINVKRLNLKQIMCFYLSGHEILYSLHTKTSVIIGIVEVNES
jgi:hypothetical protein